MKRTWRAGWEWIRFDGGWIVVVAIAVVVIEWTVPWWR